MGQTPPPFLKFLNRLLKEKSVFQVLQAPNKFDVSCKVLRKQRWQKLHQNGFQGPACSCRGRRNHSQPAQTQFQVKNLEPLLFPVNCMMHVEDVPKGGSS